MGWVSKDWSLTTNNNTLLTGQDTRICYTKENSADRRKKDKMKAIELTYAQEGRKTDMKDRIEDRFKCDDGKKYDNRWKK